MFNLNEYISSISLDTINLITLSYYSSKSEIMNIYDTNFDFDENIIPFITSYLETKPNIINAKNYCNVNSNSLITIGNQNELSNKSQISYPCFFSDLQQNNLNIQNVQGYTRKLVNTLDTGFEKSRTQTNITGFEKSRTQNNEVLVRMYKLENKKGDFSHNILNEEELTIIVWSWEYANFQIIINKQNPKQCQLRTNIYITEDNNIILSKLENFNNIIEKINKIKNEMISRVK